MKHKHWTILAYEKMDGNNYMQPVEISIESAITENDALRQAKRIVERKNYILRSIRECSTCFTQQEAMKQTGKYFKKELNEEE